MNLKPSVFAAAILLFLPCALLAQQGARPGLFEVKDVAVQASGGTVATDPAEYVLSRIVAKPGAFVSASDLARDQRALLDTGTFSDVKVLSEDVGDGAVKLVYRVVIAPRFLAPAEIHGNDGPIDEARQGMRVSIAVPEKVRESDKLFKLVEDPPQS